MTTQQQAAIRLLLVERIRQSVVVAEGGKAMGRLLEREEQQAVEMCPRREQVVRQTLETTAGQEARVQTVAVQAGLPESQPQQTAEQEVTMAAVAAAVEKKKTAEMVAQGLCGLRISSDVVLYSLCVLILSVTVFDIYQTVQQADTLFEDEANPIAAMLITRKKQTVVYHTGPNHVKNEAVHETGDVSKLVAVKVIGLLLAFVMLQWLIQHRNNYARCVIPAITVGQLLLLITLLN